MAKTREIKGRMRAVGNIQRITKTMQMIATARYQALQRRATQAQAYRRKLAEVMGELAASVGDEASHPLLTPPSRATGRELVLVVTSNRGLAGAYNANILREASRYFRSITDKEIDLEVVGKKGMGFFRFSGRQVSKAHTQFTDTPKYADAEALAQRYMDEFAQGRYDAVRVVYMQFLSISKQVPEVMTLLPMEPPGVEGVQGQGARGPGASESSAPSPYEFTPSAEDLLAELVPMAVKTRLFGAFNEAVVSEQLARMVAMKAATDAAGKMRKDLSRRFNRARQAAITTELTEIIGGTAALE